MGRIAAPYGVRGWIKVETFTDATDALLAYRTWWIADDVRGAPVERKVNEGRVHSGQLIAKLEGIETREAAGRYKGREVAVPRAALPETEEDEVYVGDLVGLEVVNRSGVMLGTIAEVSDNGAQPLMRVMDRIGGERLIPFVAAVVDEVDLDASRVLVDWEQDY